MAQCLKQYCNPWAAKTFLVCFSSIQSIIDRAHRDSFCKPKRWKTFFFGQNILLAKKVVKGPGQYKFGPAYWYHLSLVTKNITEV